MTTVAPEGKKKATTKLLYKQRDKVLNELNLASQTQEPTSIKENVKKTVKRRQLRKCGEKEVHAQYCKLSKETR